MSIFTEIVRPSLTLPPRPKVAEGPACPKCRWTGKDPGAGWTDYLWVSAETAAQMNIRDENGKPLGEILLVMCQRCKFKWREPVEHPDSVEEPS